MAKRKCVKANIADYIKRTLILLAVITVIGLITTLIEGIIL